MADRDEDIDVDRARGALVLILVLVLVLMLLVVLPSVSCAPVIVAAVAAGVDAGFSSSVAASGCCA